MLENCDMCGTPIVDSKCSCGIWKPTSYEKCPRCKSNLCISSIIPVNGQVNFGCSDENCDNSGFIYGGVFYFNFKEDEDWNE